MYQRILTMVDKTLLTKGLYNFQMSVCSKLSIDILLSLLLGNKKVQYFT